MKSLVKNARKRLLSLEEPGLEALVRAMIDAENCIPLSDQIPCYLAYWRNAPDREAKKDWLWNEYDKYLQQGEGWDWWQRFKRRYSRDELWDKIYHTKDRLRLFGNVEELFLAAIEPHDNVSDDAMLADLVESYAIEQGILPGPKKAASQEPF